MSLLDRMVVVTLPFVPKFIVGKVASQYIAGETLDDAVRTVRELNQKGFMATVDVLGEFISERAEAEANVQAYGVLLDRIAQEKLDANVSVKLTALGMDIDLQFVRAMLNKVIAAAAQHGNFVRIDMEDSPHTTDTLKIYDELRRTQNVGTVIQAYMRRSSDDIKKLMDSGKTNFRLCKGIYREPEEIAYKGREEVRDNFMRLLDQMFSGGAYVGIATHDEVLVEKSEAMIKKYKLTPDRYEFQMLLGVRHGLRDDIRSRGHRLRVYVPFGEAWYGYSTRRLKENPQIAGYVFKSMLGFSR
ncbi:proline dehydrogenase [candidate division KSB1 bacterium]|nr:MAG: proline dehydrogenase [candidate division KSB1 bacterium]